MYPRFEAHLKVDEMLKRDYFGEDVPAFDDAASDGHLQGVRDEEHVRRQIPVGTQFRLMTPDTTA